MKTIDLLEKLREKSVFKVGDIERITFCDNNYAKLINYEFFDQLA